jgi:hypothetical protein
MNHICTVTAITKDRRALSRCFGYFFTENAARIAAINNHGGMHECLYDYLVIEKQSEGIHAHAQDVQWYKWIDTDRESWEGYWYECDRPKGEGFDSIVNFNCIG